MISQNICTVDRYKFFFVIYQYSAKIIFKMDCNIKCIWHAIWLIQHVISLTLNNNKNKTKIISFELTHIYNKVSANKCLPTGFMPCETTRGIFVFIFVFFFFSFLWKSIETIIPVTFDCIANSYDSVPNLFPSFMNIFALFLLIFPFNNQLNINLNSFFFWQWHL